MARSLGLGPHSSPSAGDRYVNEPVTRRHTLVLPQPCPKGSDLKQLQRSSVVVPSLLGPWLARGVSHGMQCSVRTPCLQCVGPHAGTPSQVPTMMAGLGETLHRPHHDRAPCGACLALACRYPRPAVTVDAAIVARPSAAAPPQLLLIKRKNEPFKVDTECRLGM